MFNKSSPYLWIIYDTFMKLINPLMNRAHESIEPSFFVTYYYIISPSTVSYLHIVTFIFNSHRSVVFFWIIRSQKENLWGVTSGGQITEIFLGSTLIAAESISAVQRALFTGGAIINENGRDIGIWYTTINCKGVVEQSSTFISLYYLIKTSLSLI